MIAVFVLALYVAWTVALLGYGGAILLALKIPVADDSATPSRTVRIAIVGSAGFCAITLIGAAINFFIPLNAAVSAVMLGVGMLLCVLLRKRVFYGHTRSDWIVLMSVLVFCAAYPFMRCLNFDTDLYHIQTIKWIADGPVQLGLANLHGRFGFNSLWFIAAALLEPARVVTKNPFFIINAILLFLYGSAVFLSLKNSLFSKPSLSDSFLVATGIPWLIKLDLDFASPTPDIPVMLLSFLAVYLLIAYFENENEDPGILLLALLFSAFIVTLKLSGAALLACAGLVAAWMLFRRYRHTDENPFTRRDSMGVMILASLLIVLWAIKGVMISGCIGYPATILYFGNLPWSVPIETAISEAAWVKSWARLPGVPADEVLASWSWLVPWMKKNIKGEMLLVAIIIAGMLMMAIGAIVKKIRVFDRSFVVPFVITCIGVVFWFASAPEPRFGYGYLYAFALLLVCHGIRGTGLVGILMLGIERIGLMRFGIVLMASLAIMGGAAVYGISFDNDTVARLGALFGKHTINFEAWIPRLRVYGVASSLAGALTIAVVTMRRRLRGEDFRVRFVMAAIVASLATLFANTLFVNFRDIIDMDKYAEYRYSHKTTDDGVNIYTMIGKTASGDAPLPSSPYFNPKLKVKFSHSGRPVMFWLPREKATSRTQ